jgi:hypothetical protein
MTNRMKKLASWLFVLGINVWSPVPALSADYYVSPNATASGTGAVSNPWTLRTALASPSAVRPGDTIWVRGGVYKGKFISNLSGGPGVPIIVRNYPGERATIDGYSPTTLATAISSTDKLLTVLDISNFFPGAVFQVDNEDIYVKGLSGNVLDAVRGWNGSTPAAHAAGALVNVANNILTINGSHAWYWGLEVMSSDPARVTSQAGPFPTDIRRGTGITLSSASAIKLINCIVHDAGDAIGLWTGATDIEVHGCIMYNNGWQGPDRGHGHGLYIQNNTGTKQIHDVISFNNFATGMKAFGHMAGAINVEFKGVTSFNNGSVRVPNMPKEWNLHAGTEAIPSDLISITNSFFYHTPGTVGESLHFGFTNLDNNRITVADNYVVGGHSTMAVANWKAAVVTGNTFYIGSLGTWSSQALVNAAPSPGLTAAAFTWDNNSYFDGAPAYTNGARYTFSFPGLKNSLGGGLLSFNEWKAGTGWDRNSSYATANLATTRVFVRPNRYEPRAHVIVYNWSMQPQVTADVSSVLKAGDAYEIRDAQNYFGPPLASGVLSGSTVTIPMNLTAVAQAVGNVPTRPPHTAPQFGVFIVTKPGGAASAPQVLSRCDLNTDGTTADPDVQLAKNQVFGVNPCGTADLDGNGKCDIVDLQRVINAALGQTCRLGP